MSIQMQDKSVFGIFLSVRILSVLVVGTWYVPDEYWQSLEVAHKITFGYGYITWEWTHGLRSYIHPLIIAFIYKTLALLRLDYVTLIVYVPRVLQALLSAYSDFRFWKWCGKSKWSIFCNVTSWFWFYTASRTLLNTLETCLTVIALSKFPFIKKRGMEKVSDSYFIWIVALICAVRPTGAIIWLPLCVYHLLISRESIFQNVLGRYLPIGLIVMFGSLLIDSLAHGSLVCTWWEFLKANVLNGIGEHYGSHSWHWYLSQGLPAILGIYLLPFTLASIQVIKHRDIHIDELTLLSTIIFTVSVYSSLNHKEFRFLLPILPIMLYLSSNYLSTWSCKKLPLYRWIVAGIILVSNLVPAVYVGSFHQRGALDIMKPLYEIAVKDPSNTSILFLMPCHSTPLYSHLHLNVTARFLTCNPNLAKVDDYVDEADYFYDAPDVWLRNNYPVNQELPTIIVAYDNLVPRLADILSRYKPVHRLYNTNIGSSDNRVGKYLTIHERIHF